MPDITISDGVGASVQAACKAIEACVEARMQYLTMMTAEQRAKVIDMDLAGTALAFDIFVKPLADLVGAIKGLFHRDGA